MKKKAQLRKPRRNLVAKRKKSFTKEKQQMDLDYFFDRGVSFIERVIIISKEINEDTYDLVEVALTIMERESARSTITIKINSPGGSIYDALAVVGRIKESPCHIITKGYGSIMSAASLLFAAGDVRKISFCAWGMLHEPSLSNGDDVRLSTKKASVIQMEKEWDKWSALMASFTGYKTPHYWSAMGKFVDKFLTPEKMLAHNLATKII